MAYATLEQLIEAYGIAEVSQLLCDEESLVTESLLNDIIASGNLSAYSQQEQDAIAKAVARAETILERQTVFIDSKISGRYRLPLKDADGSPVIECCLALTRAALADDGANISKRVIEERDHWRKWLNDVQKGHAHLLNEDARKASGSESRRLTARPKSAIEWGTY